MSRDNSIKRILVIDDDSQICDIIKMFLSLEHYEVVTENTGISGLETFRSAQVDSDTQFSLILLDLSLPDVAGQQICKLIRRESDVPIIIVSANDSVSDKVICLEYGADDYISKPFENMELIARIKAILRRSDKLNLLRTGVVYDDSDNIIKVHGISIDRNNRHATLENGDIIRLTPKEFDLLLFFISHIGETLSREKIIEELWGKGTLYKWSRSLDVHVQNLRKKVERNPNSPSFIITVSGIGYRAIG